MTDWEFTEDATKRARRLLSQLLPEFYTKDEVYDHLFYVNPNASPEVRMLSIAAAVHVLLKGAPHG